MPFSIHRIAATQCSNVAAMRGRTFLFLSLLLPLSLPQTLIAQSFERIVEGIPFERNGQMLELPFTGGWDAFLPQFVDIDADGDFDLFMAQPDESGWKLTLFENVGTPQAYRFRLASTAFDTMTVGTWYQFLDSDGDGDFDLYHADGRSGLYFRRNTGSPTQAFFHAQIDSVVDIAGHRVACEYTSIPAFADIDADGDYDFFYGNVLGYIVLYRNLGTRQAPAFFFETDFWEELKIVSFGLNAPATPPYPPQGGIQKINLPSGAQQRFIPPLSGARGVSPKFAHTSEFTDNANTQNDFQHGANSIAFDDLDHDGDQDFFYGDLFHKSIYYLRNDGSAQDPAVAITDTLFPQPQPVSTLGYNIPRFADIDADGDNDFFAACLRQTQNNFLFYRNVGEATRPQLKIATLNFLPIFEVGSYSCPAFGDLDDDGDLDMLLGNLDGRFVYYENVGAPNAPSFRWVSDNYQNLRAGLYATAAPVFVDIDADGDLDLFSGDFYYGRIAFFENRGTPQAASFVVSSSNFEGIDVGNVSAPYFADGDGDGDFDLYIGKDNGGTISIYENLGSPQQPNFVKRSALTHPVPIDDSVPCLYDWDHDGLLDLFVGQRAGKILYYRGTAVLDSFVFVSSAFGGIDVGLNSAPRFVDWDNDKRVDLIVGEQSGGLNYFRAPVQAHVGESTEAPRAFALHAYPNPFAKHVTVMVKASTAHPREAPRLRVYNLLGAVIAELDLQPEGAETWRAQWLPNTLRATSGIYFVEVQWGKAQFTRKIFYLPQ